MIEISLTDFVDFVTRSGATKLTKVRQLKDRPPYSPQTDYYKTVREGIVEMHRESLPVEALLRVCHDLPPNKQQKYPVVVTAYQKFCRQSKPRWFAPCSGSWQYDDLSVRLNPEVGLFIDDTPHIIKLYFKADKISRDKVGSIIQLLEKEFAEQKARGVRFGILDVQRSKLLVRNPGDRDLMPLLYGEANSLQTIWRSL